MHGCFYSFYRFYSPVLSSRYTHRNAILQSSFCCRSSVVDIGIHRWINFYWVLIGFLSFRPLRRVPVVIIFEQTLCWAAISIEISKDWTNYTISIVFHTLRERKISLFNSSCMASRVIVTDLGQSKVSPLFQWWLNVPVIRKIQIVNSERIPCENSAHLTSTVMPCSIYSSVIATTIRKQATTNLPVCTTDWPRESWN